MRYIGDRSIRRDELHCRMLQPCEDQILLEPKAGGLAELARQVIRREPGLRGDIRSSDRVHVMTRDEPRCLKDAAVGRVDIGRCIVQKMTHSAANDEQLLQHNGTQER